MSSIFRVEKNKNFTVMSNYHLRDMSLSLKAKGLLSIILSLPEDWDYTLKGLSLICKEGLDAIRAAISELEKHGYLTRERVRDNEGKLRGTNYVVYESPVEENDVISDNPFLCEPTLVEPILENPMQDNSAQENPTQLNIDIINKDLINTDKQSKDINNNTEISVDVYPSYQSYSGTSISKDEIDRCKQKVKENIDYEYLCNYWDKSYINSIVDIITATLCSRSRDIYISSQPICAEKVKEQLLKLRSNHVEYVMECMKDNSSDIRNIRKYLLTCLYNAPETIEPYYENKVNSCMRMIT